MNTFPYLFIEESLHLQRKGQKEKKKEGEEEKEKNKHNYSRSAKQMATVAEKGEEIYSGQSITHGGRTVALVEGQPFDDKVLIT